MLETRSQEEEETERMNYTSAGDEMIESLSELIYINILIPSSLQHKYIKYFNNRCKGYGEYLGLSDLARCLDIMDA